MKLNAQARETLQAAGISQAEWARLNGCPDGKWYGDACGCFDDRCIGFHHDNTDDCRCLPALLEEHRAKATAPRKHVLSFDCWCKPTFDGERYHHQGDTSAGFLTEAEAWLTPKGGAR
ncbi:hypothetical protein [Amycolatopsis pigmentata]|uniref:Uncharacterized protein n=1 Tax=Amycolatopsis pigmentata TaxID=450801 RepID=A0ABW5G3T4_9PSEU